MRSSFFGSILSLAIAAFLLGSEVAFCEAKLPPLVKGMLYGEVVAAWGNPSEKLQQELRGKDIWYYTGGAEVVFNDGKVIDWKDPRREGIDAIGQILPIKPIAGIDNSKPSAALHENPQVVEEILSEIMKEPSSADTSAPSTPPGLPGGMPPNIVRPSDPMVPEVP